MTEQTLPEPRFSVILPSGRLPVIRLEGGTPIALKEGDINVAEHATIIAARGAFSAYVDSFTADELAERVIGSSRGPDGQIDLQRLGNVMDFVRGRYQEFDPN